MISSRHVLALAVAVPVTLLGLGLLNFSDPTPAQKLEHHRAWAAEHGIPEPGPGMRTVGWSATALGGVTLAGAVVSALVAGAAARRTRARVHSQE